MLPARDRITALYVYPTKADALAKTNGTEYTQGIVDETPRLERPFFNALPAFGECNAAMFECELSINVDLKGKWIRVATKAYATDAATSRTTYWLFCGLVDDCKYDVRQATRKLVAYDEMYRLRSVDVSTWWKEWWATQTGTVAVGTALSAMMSEYGVQGTAASTLANYFSIKADEQKKGLFGGGSFVQVLGYIGLVCACSFYIDKDGKLTACLYSNVNKTNTATAIDANVDTVNSTFGDAAGETFGSAQINVGSETAYRSGTAEPTFAQNDNPLLSGYTAANYMTVVSQLYAVAQKMSGLKAAEIELIVSTPDIILERTQAISYNGDTLMPSSIILHGRQLINETVYCTGELADAPLYQAAITEENIADGAVTADKIKAGAVNADKIEAGAITVGKLDEEAKAAMLNSNIEVGGRNLAMDSKKGWTSTAYNIIQGYMSEAWVTGETYTVSIKGTPTTGKRFGVWSDTVSTNLLIMPATPTDGKYVATAVCQGSNEPMRFSVYDYPGEGSHNASIEWIKIEKGNVASDWSPAPEDATEMEQRIYYRSSSSTAPTAPSSWVTATTTANATWTTKRMQYDRTYKYLYTCIQRKTGSNVITNSTVLLDDTTTVIDGGNIITGTVTANKISVTELASLNATIGGLSISNNSITSSNGAFALSSTGNITSTKTVSGITDTNTVSPTGFVATRAEGNSEETHSLKPGTGFVSTVEESGVYRGYASLHALDSVLQNKPALTMNYSSSGSGSSDYTVVLTPNQAEFTSEDDNKIGRFFRNGMYTENGWSKSYVNPNWVQVQSQTGASGDYSISKVEISDQFADHYKTVYVNNTITERYRNVVSAGAVSIYEDGNLKSTLNAAGLKVKTHDLLRMSPHFAQMFATVIANNSNLNSETYLKVGQYYISNNSAAGTLSNCPTTDAFTMTVEATTSTSYDNESTQNAGRVRKITTWRGAQYIQGCVRGASAWDYGAWQKIITKADFNQVTASGNFTSSTSLAYTGLSITLPETGWYTIEGYLAWSSSQPNAVMLGRGASTATYINQIAYSERRSDSPQAISVLVASATLYCNANDIISLYARFASAAQNYGIVRAQKLPW